MLNPKHRLQLASAMKRVRLTQSNARTRQQKLATCGSDATQNNRSTPILIHSAENGARPHVCTHTAKQSPTHIEHTLHTQCALCCAGTNNLHTQAHHSTPQQNNKAKIKSNKHNTKTLLGANQRQLQNCGGLQMLISSIAPYATAYAELTRTLRTTCARTQKTKNKPHAGNLMQTLRPAIHIEYLKPTSCSIKRTDIHTRRHTLRKEHRAAKQTFPSTHTNALCCARLAPGHEYSHVTHCIQIAHCGAHGDT